MKKRKFNTRAIDEFSNDENDSNVLTFSFASSEPCLRSNKKGNYYEILEISEESVNFKRLVDGKSPLLLQHNDEEQIGVVERAFIQNGKVYATVRFSTNPKPQEILKDIRDGIRRNVSFGYSIDESIVVKQPEFDLPVELVKRFTPVEISIVSCPADDTVGIDRALEDSETTDEIEETKSTEAEVIETEEVEETKAETVEETVEETKEDCSEAEGKEKTCEAEEQKCDEAEAKKAAEIEEIKSLGELMECKELAEQAISEGKTYGEFKSAVKELKNKLNVKEENNMSENTQKFSLRKALLNAVGKMSNEDAAFERSIIEENKRKFNITDADIVISRNEMRAFDGTEALNQVVYQPGMYTPNLRPPVTVDAIGTKKVAVNGPSISFSVCTSGINAGFVDINGNVPSATMDFELKTMTPKKEGAYVDVSYQSLLQDDPSAEGIVMDDIVKALDAAKDNAFWNGVSGNNEPVGILNTTGVNEIEIPSAGYDLDTILKFEKAIRDSFDYSANLKWVMASDIYYTLAKTPYSSIAVNEFLVDIKTRKCIGYDVFIDPNLPSGTVVLGNWDEVLEADFDGIVIRIAEDAQLARKQAIEIIAHRALDFLARRPKSISKSKAE